MKNVIISAILILLYSCSFSQSCTDTSYRKIYTSLNASIDGQVCTNKNDTTIIVGRYYGNENVPYVMKVAQSGNVIWAKKLNTKWAWQVVNNVLELQNKDILIVTRGGEYDSNEIFEIIKLDKDGNLLWSKYFATKEAPSLVAYYANIYEYQNDFFICYSTETALTGGDAATSLIKIDSAGNIIWSKLYKVNNKCLIAMPSAISDTNDSLVVFGRMLSTICPISMDGITETSHYAAKISKKTSLLGKSVAYRNPLDIGNNSNGGIGYGYISAVTKNNRGEYFLNSIEGFKRNNIKIRFDSNLNVYEGNEYTASNNAFYIGKIDVGDQGITTVIYRIDYKIDPINNYVAQFDAANNLLLQKRLVSPVGQSFNWASAVQANYKNNYINFVSTIEPDTSNAYLQLYQLNVEEQNSNCFGKDTGYIKVRPYPFSVESIPFFENGYDYPITVNAISDISASPLVINEQTICQQISTCTTLKITQQKDTTCTLTKTFTTHKNGDCYKRIYWQIDGTAIDSLNAINDTTVAIKFKKTWEGNTWLYASINSCMDLKDSFKVYSNATPSYTINLGKDTVLCAGNQLYLNAKGGFKNYLWQDGTTDSFLMAKQKGSYFVTVTDYCNNKFSDTIIITIDVPPVINLGNDTGICINQSILLNAGNFKKYLWNTGQGTQTIKVNAKGTYSVTVTDSLGCFVKSNSVSILNVYPLPQLTLDKKSIFCQDQNDTLFAHSTANNYLWQNASIDSFVKVTQTGKYKVTTISNYGCNNSDSVIVENIITVPHNFLPKDTAICGGGNSIITAGQNFAAYLWSTGAISNSINVLQAGNYWLSVMDNNSCYGRDTIIVSIKDDCVYRFFIPTSFTPNNDGLNDRFKPILTGNVIKYEFSIYNRLGQLVFATNNMQDSWDGTFGGVPQNTGTYVWYCRYRVKTESEKTAKGTVLLIK